MACARSTMRLWCNNAIPRPDPIALRILCLAESGSGARRIRRVGFAKEKPLAGCAAVGGTIDTKPETGT